MIKALSCGFVISMCLLACGTRSASTETEKPHDSSGCPESHFEEGDACTVPTELTCSPQSMDMSDRATVMYQCREGKWAIATSDAGAPANVDQTCPSTVPSPGATCVSELFGRAGASDLTCAYDCDKGGPAMATCSNGKWEVGYSDRYCEPADAGRADAEAGTL